MQAFLYVVRRGGLLNYSETGITLVSNYRKVITIFSIIEIIFLFNFIFIYIFNLIIFMSNFSLIDLIFLFNYNEGYTF